MHEYYLFLNLLHHIEESLVGYPNPKVKRVIIKVGEFSGVEENYLKDIMETFKGDTILAEAEILFERDPLRIRCEKCSIETNVQRGTFCPSCGGSEVKIVGGLDLVLKSIEIEDENLL